LSVLARLVVGSPLTQIEPGRWQRRRASVLDDHVRAWPKAQIRTSRGYSAYLHWGFFTNQAAHTNLPTRRSCVGAEDPDGAGLFSASYAEERGWHLEVGCGLGGLTSTTTTALLHESSSVDPSTPRQKSYGRGRDEGAPHKRCNSWSADACALQFEDGYSIAVWPWSASSISVRGGRPRRGAARAQAGGRLTFSTSRLPRTSDEMSNGMEPTRHGAGIVLARSRGDLVSRTSARAHQDLTLAAAERHIGPRRLATIQWLEPP